MSPGAFRQLPKYEQIEMMAHRREYNLRKAHADDVQSIVAKLDDPTAPKKPGPGRKSRL
jgi:hypothetical protein